MMYYLSSPCNTSNCFGIYIQNSEPVLPPPIGSTFKISTATIVSHGMENFGQARSGILLCFVMSERADSNDESVPSILNAHPG